MRGREKPKKKKKKKRVLGEGGACEKKGPIQSRCAWFKYIGFPTQGTALDQRNEDKVLTVQ